MTKQQRCLINKVIRGHTFSALFREIYHITPPIFQFVSALTLLNEAGFSPLYAILCSYIALAVIGAFTFRRLSGNFMPFFKVL